jgi:hypothetical protein
MQFFGHLRRLWRQRFLLAVGFALALAVGTLLTYSFSGFPPKLKSRQYVVGVATASVLVDSASSQVADLGGPARSADAASLSVRARLLANLLATSPLREQIARRAGIAPETLVAISPEDSVRSGTNVSVGATLDASDRRASVLNLSVRESVPIITVAVRALDRAAAARLAGGAVAQLEEYLGGVANDDRVPDARRLVVDALGPAHSATETRGPRRLVAIGVMIVLFGLWCGAIIAFRGFARGWQQAAELESDESGDPPTRSGPQQRPVPVRSGLMTPQADELPEQAHDVPELPELPERPFASALSTSPALGPVVVSDVVADFPERPVQRRPGMRA